MRIDPEEFTAEEERAWDMYFCSIAAMLWHPGNLEEPFDAKKAADAADEMLMLRRRRF